MGSELAEGGRMSSPFSDSSEPLTPAIPALSRTNRMLGLRATIAEQHGVVRRSQLYAGGWTRHQIDHELDVGRWQQLAPEVFSQTTGVLTHVQRLWLGVLHAGSPAALTHATACIEAGVRRWPSQDIHVICRKSRTTPRMKGFCFHETRRPFEQWVLVGSSPPRLELEYAALLRAERERSVKVGVGLLAATVQQNLTTTEQLYLASLEIRKLRHGETLRLALADIAGGAHSFAEIEIGRICYEHGLAAPTRQALRHDRDGRRRYLDCVWELADGTVVVLEIDGSFHLQTENWWRDMQRERGLVIDKARVLRCSTFELRADPGRIVADLRAIGVPHAN